jgi:cytochrome P450
MADKQHLIYKKLHEIYGDVVRVGEVASLDRLHSIINLLKDPMSFRFVMWTPSTRSWVPMECQKDPVRILFDFFREYVGNFSPVWDGRTAGTSVRSMIAQRNAKEHARRRRPWNRAFSTASVKEYEVTLSVRVTQLADRLADQGGSVDLALWISYFTYVDCILLNYAGLR